MISAYKSSRLRENVNAFSRVLRTAWHDSLFPSRDGRPEQVTGTVALGDEHATIHTFDGSLKICPLAGLVFRNDILLKNSSDLFMRERVPRYATIYRQEGRHYPELISLRHGSEGNYWHFFQLVATKAVAADLAGIDKSVPLLLTRRQMQIGFIARVMEMDIQQGRPIVVQEDDEVVACDRIHVIIPPLHGSAFRNQLLDRIGISGDSSQNERIYVTRSRQAENNRALQNDDDVTAALAEFGFDRIDPQTLSLDDQMTLFARCATMVSPHGAGLTNMIFRRGAPLNVVEIFNPSLVNDCYEIAADQYGFGYAALYCTSVRGKPKSGNGVVDVEELRRTVAGVVGDT